MLCLSLFLVPTISYAHTHGGYSHDSSVGLDRRNWMSGLSDSLTINELSIPGTGNSMSYGGFTDFTLTQSMNLETQLESGIRFLDLSLKHTGDTNLKAYTGLTDLDVSFIDVIKRVHEFLKKNPEEVVLVKISEHSSDSGNFGYAIKTSIEEAGLSDIIFDGSKNTNPTLGEARGKIIIFSDYNGTKWKTISYRQNSKIQDNNYLTTNWDLYSKWEKVKEHLQNTNKNHSKNTRYVNYLTGSGGSFPYFVASGHVSSGTGASRLATIYTEPGFSYMYPDFPRVNRFGVFATIAFEGTNVLTLNYILQNEVDFVGIVVADFPGGALIREIIDLNFKNKTNNSGNSNSNSSTNSNSNNSGFGFTYGNSSTNNSQSSNSSSSNKNENNQTIGSGFGFSWSN